MHAEQKICGESKGAVSFFRLAWPIINKILALDF